MRYDRARQSLDRHATYIVATYLAPEQAASPDRGVDAYGATTSRSAVTGLWSCGAL